MAEVVRKVKKKERLETPALLRRGHLLIAAPALCASGSLLLTPLPEKWGVMEEEEEEKKKEEDFQHFAKPEPGGKKKTQRGFGSTRRVGGKKR